MPIPVMAAGLGVSRHLSDYVPLGLVVAASVLAVVSLRFLRGRHPVK